MSETLKFCTTINNATKLANACERMRAAQLKTEGPTKQGNSYGVKLPGWSRTANFTCDEQGELTGEMKADNYSPYYDDRRVDLSTGERIPGTGRVHPDVEAGRKRVGEDGKWGDIRYLDRLQMEYRAGEIEAEAHKLGGTVSYDILDEEAGLMRMVVELPEAVTV